MYLETIYVLSQKSNAVRGIDIGEHLGYSKPSVSRGLGLLKDAGLVVKDKDGYIKLTEAGEKIAKTIYEATATEDACRIEHYISETTFEAIKAHIKKHSV